MVVPCHGSYSVPQFDSQRLHCQCGQLASPVAFLVIVTMNAAFCELAHYLQWHLRLVLQADWAGSLVLLSVMHVFGIHDCIINL